MDPDITWCIESSNPSKDGGWKPIWLVDNQKVEEVYQQNAYAEEPVYIKNTHRAVHLATRTVQECYLENSKVRRIRRGLWFWKHSTNNYIPFSEEISQSIENWSHEIKKEFDEQNKDGNSFSLELDDVIENDSSKYEITAAFTRSKGKNDEIVTDVNYSLVKMNTLIQSSIPIKRGYGVRTDTSERYSTLKPRHLVFLIHGIGEAMFSNSSSLVLSIKEIAENFRQLTVDCQNEDQKADGTYIDYIPIEWYSCVHSEELGISTQLALITNQSIPLIRQFGNSAIVDLLLYQTPEFQQRICVEVVRKINFAYDAYCHNNPDFCGSCSFIAHSLGSVISFDILTVQRIPLHLKQEVTPLQALLHFQSMQNSLNMQLHFAPTALFAVGSPIGMFYTIRSQGQSIPRDYQLPTCKQVYNLFHPLDPVAYRIEPLFNSSLATIEPTIVDHHAGMRTHYKIKQISTDITKSIETVQSFFSSSGWFTKKSTEVEQSKVVTLTTEISSVEEMFSKIALNNMQRIDYSLQESTFEAANPYMGALTAHSLYFENKDVARFIAQKIEIISNQK